MLSDSSVRDFADLLSSRAPVPGGGGASALVGALAAALEGMVAALTIGKKKYSPVEEEMKTLQKEAGALRENLLDLIQKDAEAFEPLSKAYGLPHGTEAESLEKARIMETALAGASAAPLAIMRAASRAVELAEVFAEKGSRIALSDAGVAAVFAKAALEGASLNVFINTKSMKDRTKAETLNKEAEALLEKYRLLADKVYLQVKSEVSG